MDFFQVIGDYLKDSWEMVIGRGAGPFHLRLLLQPLMATVLGIRAGLKDAKAGHPPYFWSVAKAEDKYDRRALLRHGWADIGKIFTIAIALDVIYGLIMFRWVYPVQSILVAFTLAIIPYLIFRGIVNRIASGRRRA